MVNKYSAIKVTENGITFDSKMEYRRWKQLELLEKAGQIKYLVPHPKLPIILNGIKICKVEGDAAYQENGKDVIEDTKGHDTSVSRLKRKLVKALYPEIDWRVITKV